MTSLMMLVACGPDREVVRIVNGNDGAAGTNGTNGLDGADGQDGADGVDGIDGEDGEDGQSCSIARPEEATYVIITCADTTAIVYDGQNGMNGADGQDGQDGSDGEDGQDGTNGTNASGCTLTLKSQDKYYLTCGSTTILINNLTSNGNGNN